MGMDISFHGVTSETLASIKAALTSNGFSVSNSSLSGESVSLMYEFDESTETLRLNVHRSPTLITEGTLVGSIYDDILGFYHMNHKTAHVSSIQGSEE